MPGWLHIVGIGEEGLAGLSPPARAVVEAAETIVGDTTHTDLDVNAQCLDWPKAFDDLVAILRAEEGNRVVVLIAGDAPWYSIGGRIGRAIPPADIVYHPHRSAFQLIAARIGWSLADAETLTVHGRPIEQMVAFIQPDQRLLVLAMGADTPARIARFLTERGFGQSRMTVFAMADGAKEPRFDGMAESCDIEMSAFNMLAIECVAAPDAALQPRVPGLQDDLFQHDGTVTRREVRAATLAKLMPMRGALLWDVGTGSGSVAIEWMRAARYARSIGIEPRADRRMMAAANALALGTPKLEIVAGQAPEAFRGLPSPDAIFLGSGVTEPVFAAAWAALRPLGRLVANSLSSADEGLLLHLHEQHGGELARIQVSRRQGLKGAESWQQLAPVAQWSIVKR